MKFTEEGRVRYTQQLGARVVQQWYRDASKLEATILEGYIGLKELSDEDLERLGRESYGLELATDMLEGQIPFCLPVRLVDGSVIAADDALLLHLDVNTPAERAYVVKAINAYETLLAFYNAAQQGDTEQLCELRDKLKEMKL